MIEVKVNLRCDVCRDAFLDEPWIDEDSDQMRLLLLTAELAGWKVYRLARDVYYGKAWCTHCRPDRCQRCNGRGYYPKWPLDPYYGEPSKVECEVCDGKRWLPDQPGVADSA